MADAVAGARRRGLELRQRLLRRAPKASDRAGSEEVATPKPHSPVAYKTFSANLAPSLTALGGSLAIAGGLGAWVRATLLVSEGLAPEEVQVVMGHGYDVGIGIALFGAAAAIAAAFWLHRSLVVKVVPAAASLIVIGLAAWRVPVMDRWAADLASSTQRGELDFIAYHAGLGWGAWLLVVASVLLALGTLTGILRELDIRKGNV